MRNLSAAVAAAIMAIALYFALTWGFNGLQALTSPSYGLDGIWHSQFIFGVGHLLGLGPVGSLKFAAFIAAVQLVAAGVCAIHVIDRARGVPRSEWFEGALILIVAIALLSLAPAAWSHGGVILSEQVLQLGFALAAFALCAAERVLDRRGQADTLSETEGAIPFQLS